MDIENNLIGSCSKYKTLTGNRKQHAGFAWWWLPIFYLMKKIKNLKNKLGIFFIAAAGLSFPIIFFTSFDNFAFYLFFASFLALFFGAIFSLPKNNSYTKKTLSQEILTNPTDPRNPHYRFVRFYK